MFVRSGALIIVLCLVKSSCGTVVLFLRHWQVPFSCSELEHLALSPGTSVPKVCVPHTRDAVCAQGTPALGIIFLYSLCTRTSLCATDTHTMCHRHAQCATDTHTVCHRHTHTVCHRHTQCATDTHSVPQTHTHSLPQKHTQCATDTHTVCHRHTHSVPQTHTHSVPQTHTQCAIDTHSVHRFEAHGVNFKFSTPKRRAQIFRRLLFKLV